MIGGGPGGLYAALLLKKHDPDRHVVLYEKNPAGATYGWGVVFSDRTITSFREADYSTYVDITDRFVLWEAIDVRIDGEVIRCEGQVFSGIARRALLAVLQQRCADLGVELHWETELDVDDVRADFDLVVGADGVHSPTRERFAPHLGPSVREGRSRYIWFGTDRAFDSFTFAFRTTEHGLFQAHAYPFDGTTSTFIVECRPEVWRAAGLDRSSERESIALCEKIFADDLSGRSLMSNNSKWLTFPTLKCKTWHVDNVVLLGDAVHTAHFSIGSGTKLAMEDAIALANAFERPASFEQAVANYELDRKPRVAVFQDAARQSQTYFEHTSRYRDMPPIQFAFNLLTRSGRVDYGSLRLKDPSFVGLVDGFMAGRPGSVAPPPAFNPLDLAGLHVTNRIAVVCRPSDTSSGGLPDEVALRSFEAAEGYGVGLVVTDVVAVSASGRITSGSAGLYDDDHERAWSQALSRARRDGAAWALHLGHAGARGATHPRQLGVDRPLGPSGWDLVSASALPYTPASARPRAMERADMDSTLRDFVDAVRRGDAAGFDVLGLHMGSGYLLGSFISPLTNRRADDYGGDLASRLRYPLEVVDAVRGEWPDDKPLFASLTVDDGARDGLTLTDAVHAARNLKERGCDFVRVLAGQTTGASVSRYDPYWLMHLTDVIRNEAGIATMPGLSLPNVDAINTAVAGGRADLCSMRDPSLR